MAARHVHASSPTDQTVELDGQRHNAHTVAALMAERMAKPTDAGRSSVAAARRVVRELAQPGHFPRSDAAAAPVDHVTQRQTLVVSHRPQRLPSAPLSVPDQSIAFSKRGQHRDVDAALNARWSARRSAIQIRRGVTEKLPHPSSQQRGRPHVDQTRLVTASTCRRHHGNDQHNEEGSPEPQPAPIGELTRRCPIPLSLVVVSEDPSRETWSNVYAC